MDAIFLKVKKALTKSSISIGVLEELLLKNTHTTNILNISDIKERIVIHRILPIIVNIRIVVHFNIPDLLQSFL